MKNRVRRINRLTSVFICIFLFVAAACNEKLTMDKEDVGEPTITDFSPKSGVTGTRVRLTGTYLKGVSKIKIGDVDVDFERVNSREVMLITTAAVTGGTISVTTSEGTAVSENEFTAEFYRPTLADESPSEGDLFSIATFRGDYLDLISEVYFGDVKAEIKDQSENKLDVQLPLVDSDGEVEVSFKYPYGLTTEALKRNFKIIKVRPSVSSKWKPEEVSIGEIIRIPGENLQTIEKIVVAYYAEDHNGEKICEAIIDSKASTSNEIVCSLPSSIEKSIKAVEFRFYYWVSHFQPIGPMQLKVASFYLNRNVALYGSGHVQANFFSGITGESYSPCEYEANMDKIHLAVYSGAGGLNIGSFHTTTGFLNTRWKCGGKEIPNGNSLNMRFRKLKETDEVDAKYIKMINDGTLGYFNAETAAADGLSYSTLKQVIRHKDTTTETVYNQTNDEGIDIGGINLLMVVDKATSKEVSQIGFVKLISVERSVAAAADGIMVVDFYFQKDENPEEE